MSAVQALLKERWRNPRSKIQVDAALKRLDEIVDLRLRQEDRLPLLSRLYIQGHLAWRRGDLESARGRWREYIDLRNRIGPKEVDMQFQEVRDYYSLVRPKPIEIKIVAASAADVSTNTPRPKRRRARRAKRPTRAKAVTVLIERDAAVDRRKAASLFEKAARAHHEGRYEHARKLFRMAGQLDPASTKIKEGLKSLEADMQN